MVAVGKRRDEVVGTRDPGDAFDRREGSIRSRVADVVEDGVREELCLLETRRRLDAAGLRPRWWPSRCRQFVIVPSVGDVEPRQKVGERRLASTGGAHQGNDFADLAGQIDAR